MGLGAFLEPLIVVSFLGGGTLVNRNTAFSWSRGKNYTAVDSRWDSPRAASPAPTRRKSDLETGDDHRSRSPPTGSGDDASAIGLGSLGWSAGSNHSTSTLLESDDETTRDPRWRKRTLRFWKWQRTIITPNTEQFKDRLLSRVLLKFPFLVEAWYWALIYWVYQLGRAITASLIIDESVIDVARRHALQLIHLEQRLGLFFEVPFQQYFLEKPELLHWINRTYSFIHIPGTILFLIVLYYISTTRPERQLQKARASGLSPTRWRSVAGRLTPELYERRRRTMAMCNLLAFIVFTAWPCMPPRLLSSPSADPTGNTPEVAAEVQEGMSIGFVDTVHSVAGESSVWTTNRFCNQYAAMPSLHFGYSFLVGLTIATIPLESNGRNGLKRFAIVIGAMIYPAIILTAIVATANHFVLDAVAGACVCLLAWHYNDILLNLLGLEDYFLWLVRIHKPAKIFAEGKGISARD